MSSNEWREYKIKDVCTKIGSGSTPRGGSSVYLSEGNIKFIRSQNVYNNYFDYSGLVFINNEAADKLKNVEVKENDVLLNITGDSVARCTIVPKDLIPARVNQHVCILRANEKYLESFYLKSYLVNRKMQESMISLARNGGTRAALTKGMIENFKILIPEIKEQKAIAKILSDLDEKIEINNKINNNLEKIAQAIFKQWFVDFEFPNENGEPYKSSGGEMVESELGKIPKGWKVDEIYNIASVIYGAPFSSKNFNEDKIGLPLIRIRDLKTSMPLFYTEENHKKATKVKTGDILVGMDAEFIPTIWMGTEGYLNQRVCMFKPNKEYVHNYFLYEIIKPYMELMQFSKVGTTVIHLGKGDIDNMKVIIPNSNTLKLFYYLINPIYEKMIDIANEKRTLINLRDSLLPKLMSGEIRVPLEEN